MDIDKAFQDLYPDDYSHCYGCGNKNEHGHHIKSYWDGDESICKFTPDSHYSVVNKDILYGCLIASLIDCHGAATAAAAKAKELGIEMIKGNMPRFVTASLKVDYLLPTPIGVELELRGFVKEIKNRKVTIEVILSAEKKLCAKGELILIQIKDE